MTSIFEARDIVVRYGNRLALDHLSTTIRAGELTAIVGPSGSGKSTLLHALAGIVTPQSGEVSFNGQPLGQFKESERANLRLSQMGFVFQNPEMVPELTLLENVMLPLELLRTPRQAARERAIDELGGLGLDDSIIHRSTREVSGGQAQRAAIARAVVCRPQAILADEPTGALDSKNGERVVDLLRESVGEWRAVVIVTHNLEIADAADRVIKLRDGKVVGDSA